MFSEGTNSVQVHSLASSDHVSSSSFVELILLKCHCTKCWVPSQTIQCSVAHSSHSHLFLLFYTRSIPHLRGGWTFDQLLFCNHQDQLLKLVHLISSRTVSSSVLFLILVILAPVSCLIFLWCRCSTVITNSIPTLAFSFLLSRIRCFSGSARKSRL